MEIKANDCSLDASQENNDNTWLVHWALSDEYIPDEVIEKLLSYADEWNSELCKSWNSKSKGGGIAYYKNCILMYNIDDPLNWIKPSLQDFKMSLAKGLITLLRIESR